MVKRRLWPAAILLLGGHAACGGLPKINGTDLPPPAAEDSMPVYRDLATIPEAPSVSPQKDREEAEKALLQDRAMTAQAADRLREETVTIPAPAPPIPSIRPDAR